MGALLYCRFLLGELHFDHPCVNDSSCGSFGIFLCRLLCSYISLCSIPSCPVFSYPVLCFLAFCHHGSDRSLLASSTRFRFAFHSHLSVSGSVSKSRMHSLAGRTWYMDRWMMSSNPAPEEKWADCRVQGQRRRKAKTTKKVKSQKEKRRERERGKSHPAGLRVVSSAHVMIKHLGFPGEHPSWEAFTWL